MTYARERRGDFTRNTCDSVIQSEIHICDNAYADGRDGDTKRPPLALFSRNCATFVVDVSLADRRHAAYVSTNAIFGNEPTKIYALGLV